jgi:hypothetical protein
LKMVAFVVKVELVLDFCPSTIYLSPFPDRVDSRHRCT